MPLNIPFDIQHDTKYHNREDRKLMDVQCMLIGVLERLPVKNDE